MTLFWFDSPLDTADDVKRKANSVEVRPLQFRVDPEDVVIIHRPIATLRAIDNHVGYSENILLVLSEDSFSTAIKLSSTTVYVRELVFAWERAAFKWIQHPLANAGEILQVKFIDVPARSFPEDYDYFHETEYHLTGDVFHFSRP